jgi:hypothetical protein
MNRRTEPAPDPVVSYARMILVDRPFRRAWQDSPQQRARVLDLLWRDGPTRDRYESKAALSIYLDRIADGRAASAALLAEDERLLADQIRRGMGGR